LKEVFGSNHSESVTASAMEENIPEGLTVFSLPEHHRRRLRATNMLERLNKELNRRARLVTIFPNGNSGIRLVAAHLMEANDDHPAKILEYVTRRGPLLMKLQKRR
jgi:transposase-like protein